MKKSRRLRAMLSRAMSLVLGLWVCAPVHGYFDGEGHKHEAQVTQACERCAARLESSTGSRWTGCVVDELLEAQRVAKEAGRSDYFPVVPHNLDPFGPKTSGSSPGHRQTELLKNMLRNFSCDYVDGGSQPLRSMTWEVCNGSSPHA